MKKVFPLLIIQFYFFHAMSHANNFAGGWKAGVAAVNITPSTPMWLAGYGNRDHVAEGKLHDLWAKAVALEDKDGHKAVLITIDICTFSKELSDRVRDRLKKEKNISRADIIINCSHTHSGPVVGNSLANIYPLDAEQKLLVKNYTAKLEEQLGKVAAEALDNLEPVELFAENGLARFQVNRRNNNEASLLVQPELKGPNDYSVPVIKVVDQSKKIKAIIFGYACHNTVLNGYEWSGDYAGFAQIELQELYPGATALFFQGAGADQNPLPRRSVPLARQYGQELAYAVEKVLSEEMRPLSPVLSSAYGEIELSLNEPEKEKLMSIAADSSIWYLQGAAKNILQKIDKGETLAKTYPYPVQVWKIGELPIFALGGELVIQYAIEIKKLYGLEAFVMGYSNDIMSYIPSLTVLRESNDKGYANVFYDPANHENLAYEGGLTSQLEYGFPATWSSNIETRIMGQVQELAAKAGVSLAVYK